MKAPTLVFRERRPVEAPEPRVTSETAAPAPASLSADAIQARLQRRLSRLDGEQLQLVEIVVAAISRGAR